MEAFQPFGRLQSVKLLRDKGGVQTVRLHAFGPDRSRIGRALHDMLALQLKVHPNICKLFLHAWCCSGLREVRPGKFRGGCAGAFA